MSIDISVVMPCFNEERNIRRNVEIMFRYLNTLGKNFEIILVNDGSTDTTGKVVNNLAKDVHIRAVHHKWNLGRGAGIRSGLHVAKGNVIITFDADLSYSPNHIEVMLRAMENENADVVIASAYHKRGSVRNVPWFRALVSRLGNKVLTLGSEFTVITCIVRLYRKKVVESLEFFSNGKEFHLESFSKIQDLGYKIVEVPGRLHWKNKPSKKKSTVKRRSTFKFAKQAAVHLNYIFNETPFVYLGILASLFIIVGLGIGVFIISEWLQGLLTPDRPLIILMVLFLITGLITLLFTMVANQNRSLRKELVRTQSMIKKRR